MNATDRKTLLELKFIFGFQIVWDAENKRWINKDSDEGEAEAFKPPPKMNEMMSMNNSNIPTPMALTPIESPLTNPMNAYNNTTNANAPPPQPQAQSQLQPQLQQQPQVDGASNGPAVTPSLQSNMFKMQRNKSKNRKKIFFISIY